MEPYSLVRSSRKTVALYVRPDASLEVRAPLRVSRAAIDRFVASKERWIGEKRRTALERLERQAAFRLSGDDAEKAARIQAYKQRAKQLLPEKTAAFTARMGLKPRAVKINSAKTRWGSCSAQKNINYSWRLVMAEDDVIDYVVVHELAHLREMNHSPRFWAIVAGVLPDYRERQKRLKLLQKRLADEDWDI